MDYVHPPGIQYNPCIILKISEPSLHNLSWLFSEKSRPPPINFCFRSGRFGVSVKSSAPVRHFGRSFGPPCGFSYDPKPLLPHSQSPRISALFGPLRGIVVSILRTRYARSPLRRDLTPKS